MSDRLQRLLDRAREGSVPATSQLITALEAGGAAAAELRPRVHALAGGAHVVGVTGAPGSGKSTLVGALARELRGRGRTVAIVAVDPSSSLTGGAILGDRIRMHGLTLDPGTFVRSMSTRGWLGGVSRATVDAVAALDATGWDVVIVETVGVGQAEVEIVQIAHTTAVVSVPGLGDDVQAIKAGLLEVADLHVVNKCDRPDANKTISELLGMLTLEGPPAAGGWARPVIGTSALGGTGVVELADAVDGHLAWLRGSGELRRRERKAAAARIRAIARDLVTERLHDPAALGRDFDELVEQVAARRRDPHSAAAALVGGLASTDHHLQEATHEHI